MQEHDRIGWLAVFGLALNSLTIAAAVIYGAVLEDTAMTVLFVLLAILQWLIIMKID